MKKKLLSLVIMCFMAVSILFAGCTPKGLTDNPATDANVISNGGMAVVKGDYLYYVNGYIDETSLTTDDNKSGKVEHAGIYRTKLVDGKIQKNEDGFLKSTDLVVSKVVGFSNGGFYIIDDFIYYATPYMNLDRDGTLQSSRVEFHKINIDGTNDKTLYVTSKNEDKLDWTIYTIDGSVYLVAYVDQKIIIFNATTSKLVKEVEVASSQSYAFLKEAEYKTGQSKNGEFQKNIYYTRAITSDDGLSGDFKGNVVCRVNIASGETTTLEMSKEYTYSIKTVTANEIYYTKTNSTISGLQLLFKKDISSTWNNSNELQLSNAVYTNYYVCAFGSDLIIADDSNGTYLIEDGEAEKISSTQKTVVAMSGNDAYYIKDNMLYKFDVRGEITSGEIAFELVTDENKTHTITNDHFIDFDGQRVYVYADYTSESGETNKYLNYVDSDLTERFVGKFEANDVPEKPEQDEKYGEDPDVKYIPWID